MSEFGEKLKARTKQFAFRVIKMTNALPRSYAGKVFGHQILRSGTSIGANYREAYRARSTAEFLAKMGDCLKESDETSYWLELSENAHLLSAAKLNALKKENDELTALFVTIIKTKRSGL